MKKKHSLLQEQIESLLPGALSAGLASSYGKVKESFSTKIKIFNATVFVLYFILLIFGLCNIASFSTIDDAFNFEQIIKRLLIQGPFLFTLIWLITFVTSRLNQNVRMQQEYAHKEALASSYANFKTQISSISTEEEKQREMLEKLMTLTIESVSFNPSKTLDKMDNKMPIEKALDRVADIIEKVTNK